jgi:hypothetical protein
MTQMTQDDARQNGLRHAKKPVKYIVFAFACRNDASFPFLTKKKKRKVERDVQSRNSCVICVIPS